MNRLLIFHQLILFCMLHALVRTAPTCFDITNVYSHTSHLEIDSLHATFQLCQIAKDDYNLVERTTGSDKTASYHEFNRTEVEFLFMKSTEIKFQVFKPNDIQWLISCAFSSIEEAQDFYVAVNVGRQEPKLIASANYLKTSSFENTNNQKEIIAKRPTLFCLQYFNGEITVVIKNENGKPVLIFPKKDIKSAYEHCPPSEVYLSINNCSNQYEFGFFHNREAENFASRVQELIRLDINLPPTRFSTEEIDEIISQLAREVIDFESDGETLSE